MVALGSNACRWQTAARRFEGKSGRWKWRAMRRAVLQGRSAPGSPRRGPPSRRTSPLSDWRIDLAVRRDRGREEHAVEPRLPDTLARLRVSARQYADVVGEVKQTLVMNERRRIRPPARRTPDDVALGN